MASKPRVAVIRAAGVNCETETAYAWSLAGAEPTILHVNQLIDSPSQLQAFQILTVPGGFSYGDDVAAGKIFALQLEQRLGEALRDFREAEKLILGICNGFQVLCKAGLLPGATSLPAVTVTYNVSAKYEDRWVRLERQNQECAFLNALQTYEMPVAHGEGRVMVAQPQDMDVLQEKGCVALKYASTNGKSASYPDNPNGSVMDVAGLCDPSGRVFGLMPHPERFCEVTNHPHWTTGEITRADGRAIFESAVAYLR